MWVRRQQGWQEIMYSTRLQAQLCHNMRREQVQRCILSFLQRAKRAISLSLVSHGYHIGTSCQRADELDQSLGTRPAFHTPPDPIARLIVWFSGVSFCLPLNDLWRHVRAWTRYGGHTRILYGRKGGQKEPHKAYTWRLEFQQSFSDPFQILFDAFSPTRDVPCLVRLFLTAFSPVQNSGMPVVLESRRSQIQTTLGTY